MPAKLTALAIEPNSALLHPYDYLKTVLDIKKVESLKQAIPLLTQHPFDCYLISTSFSPEKQLSILESLKFNFSDKVIPLLFIVDLNQPLSSVPGTHWANKVAILASNASQKLTLSTIESLMSGQ